MKQFLSYLFRSPFVGKSAARSGCGWFGVHLICFAIKYQEIIMQQRPSPARSHYRRRRCHRYRRRGKGQHQQTRGGGSIKNRIGGGCCFVGCVPLPLTVSPPHYSTTLRYSWSTTKNTYSRPSVPSSVETRRAKKKDKKTHMYTHTRPLWTHARAQAQRSYLQKSDYYYCCM